LISIVYSAALFAGAPFILVFSLAVSGKVLWEGKLPVSGKVWWPARAKKIDRRHGYSPSRETTLCRMIELRRRKDPRLRNHPTPSNWPMFELWATTEAMILTTLEQYLTLKHDGLSDLDAVQKIEAFRSAFGEDHMPNDLNAKNYLVYRLGIEDPQYLAFGPVILDKAILIAREFAVERIKNSETEEPYPPSDWLQKRLTISEVESDHIRSQPERHGSSENRVFREWENMKVRMLGNDQLWYFSSPPATWEKLGGRAGIALVRNDRSIVSIVTMMN
jgi:hypothetical protein